MFSEVVLGKFYIHEFSLGECNHLTGPFVLDCQFGDGIVDYHWDLQPFSRILAARSYGY